MQRILGEYPFDAVLCPVGLFNLAYEYSYAQEVVPLARQRGMAVLAMKVFGAGRVKHAASIEPYLRYTLNQTIDTAVIGCDSIAQLEQTVRVVKSQPPALSDAEQAVNALAFEPRDDGVQEIDDEEREQRWTFGELAEVARRTSGPSRLAARVCPDARGVGW